MAVVILPFTHGPFPALSMQTAQRCHLVAWKSCRPEAWLCRAVAAVTVAAAVAAATAASARTVVLGVFAAEWQEVLLLRITCNQRGLKL